MGWQEPECKLSFQASHFALRYEAAAQDGSPLRFLATFRRVDVAHAETRSRIPEWSEALQTLLMGQGIGATTIVLDIQLSSSRQGRGHRCSKKVYKLSVRGANQVKWSSDPDFGETTRNFANRSRTTKAGAPNQALRDSSLNVARLQANRTY